jgi:hypothetical protein
MLATEAVHTNTAGSAGRSTELAWHWSRMNVLNATARTESTYNKHSELAVHGRIDHGSGYKRAGQLWNSAAERKRRETAR